MTFVDNSMHAVNPLAAGPAPAAATASPDEGGFSFDDLVDIVNPLQHLPVVGTLYRAITGDQIKTFPKIAGDALYGGMLGFAGSLADSMFEKITGKNLGDTVLAQVEDVFSPAGAAPTTAVASAAGPDFGDRVLAAIRSVFSSSDAPATGEARAAPIDTTATPVASTAPALPPPATAAPAALDTIVVPGQDALLSALSRNGVSPDTATRAAEAYRRSLSVAPGSKALPEPALHATIVQ
ncbi:MAG: hypothetical protein WDM86_09605 [Rhizomicrobium sp.]